MPYHPLDLHNDLPEKLEEFVRRHIDPDLEELHYLMLVRREDQGPKGSFQKSFAKVLLSIADGVAQTLEPGNLRDGERFKGFLKRHYPWDWDRPDGLSIEEALVFLWDDARCPLLHRLGLKIINDENPSHGKKTKFGQLHSITDEKLETLEKLKDKRPFSSNSIQRNEERTVLWIESFYWGLRIAIENALTDEENWGKIIAHIEEGKFDKRGYKKRKATQ